MSVVDIIVLSITAIGFILGLFGKWIRKVGDFVIFIVSIVAAYIISINIKVDVGSFDMSKVFSSLDKGTTLQSYISGLEILPSSITNSAVAIASTITRIFLFWVIALGIILVLSIIAKIVFTIVFSVFKKGTAWRTFGLLGAVKGFILGLLILLPIYVFSPVLTNISSLPGLDSFATDANIAMVEDQFEKSWTIKMMDKLFSNTNLKIMTYEYEDNDGDIQSGNIYSTMKDASSLLKVTSKFSDLSGESIVSNLTEMDDDEIEELFDSIAEDKTIRETVVSTIESALKEATGSEVDLSNVDFSKESDTVIAIKSFIEKSDSEKITASEVKDLVEKVSQSTLVYEIAKAVPGAFADEVTEEQKKVIDTELLALKTSKTITEEQYNTFKALFEEQE